ncbi:Uma2 family endonuclease [bacterium]|nr:Uma2 family endonuclease [bacterium]
MRAVIADMPKHWLAERKNSEAAQWDEVWEGVLHMPPMPNRIHQRFSRDLQAFLQTHWAAPLGAQVDQEVNLTTPEDEGHWTLNFRIPDLVLLPPDRFHIDKTEYMAGAPLVVVEVKSPRDETYEKFPFYAKLGVPEVWVFDRDTRAPELYALAAGPAYQAVAAGADGWAVSAATGVAFRHAGGAKVAARVGGGAAIELPAG